MNRNTVTIGAAIVLLLVAAAAYVLWPRPAGDVPAELPAAAADAGAMPSAAAPVAAPASAASVPAEPASAATDLPALAADDTSVQAALVDLLGRPAVLKMLLTDGFAQRVAATVDNLPRTHVPPRLWPVAPTPGRFMVDAGPQIALDNAERYGPFVRLVEGTDPAAAAALYRRLYPQLQAAYRELGYPDGSFHARLLEVIDHLLATPTVAPPLAVTLTEVKGPIPTERPWVRYEYADPALESLSAGQKILLRTGEVNQRRLTVWLRSLRAQLAR